VGGVNFLSVCSGIEAASVAWKPLGWHAQAFSEIEKFPSQVLAHHYADVPNLGDMTKYQEWPDAAIDLLVGGTPCQSFSVAGLRKGLGDPRGNLMLTYGAIAGRYRPRWLVWENVPGVLSSNGGRDFGTFLGMLAELGYGFAYRILDAQYIRVDGFARAVPQRRRRVFVVGYLGDWRRAAAVLFERESLCGHPAPSRKAGEAIAPTLSARTKGGGGLGTDFDCDGGVIRWPAEVASTLNAHYGDKQGLEDQHALGGGSSSSLPSVSLCLNAGAMGRLDAESETLIPTIGGVFDVTPFDTTQITSPANYSAPKSGDACHPLAAGMHAPAIAFTCKDHGADAGDVSPTLRSMGYDGSHANGGGQVAVAFAQNQRDEVRVMQVAGALAAEPGAKQQTYAQIGMAVRRLTPTECERLQGFPDGYTDIRHGGKPTPDGCRYKSLGNSMAVNAMRWIGERILLVDRCLDERRIQQLQSGEADKQSTQVIGALRRAG
jgi:DNA (cytosine-5)-methyltransferase 1